MKRQIFAMVVFVFYMEALAAYAYAYIDPGTGSMFIQAVLAVIAACAVSVGVFWRRLKAFLRRTFSRNKHIDGNSNGNSNVE
ncbi:MAG: hypothetical protein U5R49_15340 [Deltaproteobacteria bacterium]|nr:hypothetical protein [Deltaproteobacteria bacterium]